MTTGGALRRDSASRRRFTFASQRIRSTLWICSGSSLTVLRRLIGLPASSRQDRGAPPPLADHIAASFRRPRRAARRSGPGRPGRAGQRRVRSTSRPVRTSCPSRYRPSWARFAGTSATTAGRSKCRGGSKSCTCGLARPRRLSQRSAARRPRRTRRQELDMDRTEVVEGLVAGSSYNTCPSTAGAAAAATMRPAPSPTPSAMSTPGWSASRIAKRCDRCSRRCPSASERCWCSGSSNR